MVLFNNLNFVCVCVCLSFLGFVVIINFESMSHRSKGKANHSSHSSDEQGNNKSKTKNNGHANHSDLVQQQRQKIEREQLKIWKKPKDTIKYFILECLHLIREYGTKMLKNTFLIILICVVGATLGILSRLPGSHQRLFAQVQEFLMRCIYWMALGIISSIGLGTGLHTFLLYLGPFIVSVTLAGYACNSLDFPSPPYPDEIVCPDDILDSTYVPSLWEIMGKVRLEAFCWGAGTALGELPPYFVARAARLSGSDETEDLQEIEELQKKRETGQKLSWIEQGKLTMERMVEKVGFFGILACASIPNPLFDLAGITCGHFLVPFPVFFGATLIGKAVIKMHIQKVFVILMFNESFIKKLLDKISLIPHIGERVQGPFMDYLETQKKKYHRGAMNDAKVAGKVNLFKGFYDALVFIMILYFLLSIVNAFAQNYHKRMYQKRLGKKNQKSLKAKKN